MCIVMLAPVEQPRRGRLAAVAESMPLAIASYCPAGEFDRGPCLQRPRLSAGKAGINSAPMSLRLRRASAARRFARFEEDAAN